jgi:uncharacterized membrane protein
MIQPEHFPGHVLVARLLERRDPIVDLRRIGLTIGLSVRIRIAGLLTLRAVGVGSCPSMKRM